MNCRLLRRDYFRGQVLEALDFDPVNLLKLGSHLFRVHGLVHDHDVDVAHHIIVFPYEVHCTAD